MKRFRISIFAVALTGLSLFGHYTWLETKAELKAGEKTTVKIGHGHEVTNSESAISLNGLELVAHAPSGKKIPLKPVASAAYLEASFTPDEMGVYRFVLTQDRGVMSQTTKGYKAGGRDVHPDAKTSMKLWRSASVYAWTQGAKYQAGKPLGLPLEVIADRKADSLELTVMRNGKPAPGVEVGVNVAGKEDADPIGKTDGSGKLLYKVPVSTKGAMLLVATLSEPAAKGANYDKDSLTSTLELTW